MSNKRPRLEVTSDAELEVEITKALLKHESAKTEVLDLMSRHGFDLYTFKTKLEGNHPHPSASLS
jgi:hypothetical protein